MEKRIEENKKTKSKYIRDGILPGFKLVGHPRKFNKPLACQSGLHKWGNRLINGMPSLVCKKCGATIGEGIYHKTWSKQDLKKIKLMQVKGKPRTEKQRMEESWNAYEMLKKKFTDKQIKMMIEKRRRGLPID